MMFLIDPNSIMFDFFFFFPCSIRVNDSYKSTLSYFKAGE